MRQILIATHNIGKLRDLEIILSGLNFEVTSLDKLGIEQEAKEDGDTFAKNSLTKAKFYANISGKITLADDSGLIIPVLNNQPGVHARRWESEQLLTDQELIDKALFKLKDFKGDDRKASLVTVITVYDPRTNIYWQEEDKLEGRITDSQEAEIISGFPFQSIFYVTSAGKLLADFSKTDKEKYNHRRQAIEKLKSKLIQL